MFKPGWYILLYHDVSWEENVYVRGLGGECPPDLFRDHVAALAKVGELASLDRGFELWKSGRIRRPTFSFWFDDGLAGVRKYARPLLEQAGVTAGISVCSRFVTRSELFWRFKLSYLAGCDGLRFLRSRLKPFGCTMDTKLKSFLLDRFSGDVLKELDAVYTACTTPAERSDAFRMFETRDGLEQLRHEGWLLANHTSAHYPVGESTAVDLFGEQFTECDEFLARDLKAERPFWVLPFDRVDKRVPDLIERFRVAGASDRIVLVGNEVNRPDATDHGLVKRIYMPIEPSRQALRFLARLPYAPA